jgi:hypothetical protein
MTLQNIGEGRFQKVRLDDLITDGRFNRPVRTSHVERLASDFTPAAFGVVEIWKRDDDVLVILDGQHRAELLRMLGYPTNIKCVPALVHEGLTLDMAAELFVKLNASKLVGPWDRFKALLTATHKRTCDIDRIVRSHGLRVGGGKKDGVIAAVTAVEAAYTMGEPEGVVLGKTLAALTAAWGDMSEAYGSALIRGTSLYFHEHRDTDPADLADALMRDPGAPVNVMSRAKTLAGSRRMNLDEAIAITLSKIMEKKRKPRRPKAVGDA